MIKTDKQFNMHPSDVGFEKTFLFSKVFTASKDSIKLANICDENSLQPM